MFDPAVNRFIHLIAERLAMPGGKIRVGTRGPAHVLQHDLNTCTVLVVTLRLPDRSILELKRSLPLATLCFGDSDEIDALVDAIVEQFNRAIAVYLEGPESGEGLY